jgi:hypothetical protein
MTHEFLVGQDYMRHREDNLDIDPGIKLAGFGKWFGALLNTYLLDGWWERHLERAYQSGVKFGKTYGEAAPLRMPALLKQAAQHELRGIVEAILQRVTREIAQAAQQRTRPQIMYRQVLEQIRKVGEPRLNAFANAMTVPP